VRREFESDGVEPAVIGDVERRLSLWERISNVSAVRKLTILVVMLIAWEVYVRAGDVSAYILPAFSSTGSAFFDAITVEGLARKVWNSVTVLLSGYIIGIAIASLLTTLAVATRFGSDLLSTLTAMLNPLPAIALLPMAMLWFGLGKEAIVFTLLHSVVWPVALNMHTGFMGVSDTQRMVGRNYGLRGLSYVIKLLIPAAFPSILTGMKIGWAYAWRTLIAAELVFGGSVIDAAGTDAGGLGWFIFSNQMDMRIPYVFAGLFTVILVGVLMESIVFRNLETRTVIRWGMQDQ
jgi:NitT/TauT family transport system permease protein